MSGARPLQTALLVSVLLLGLRADVDVAVSAGSPLDWLNELPHPIPTEDRTAVGGRAVTRVRVETPAIQSTNVFAYARITTVDLLDEIPWTVRRRATRGSGSYPPELTDDVFYLALAVYLRRLLHPAQLSEGEAVQYLTYLGEPAVFAAEAARRDPSLEKFAETIQKRIPRMPRMPPAVPRGKTVYEAMMTRLVWEDLTHAYPGQLDGRFAGRIALLGEEVVPYIILASKSDHLFLKRNATLMLGRYAHPAARKRLRELARDEDPVVRTRALVGLGRRRDAEARGLIRRMLVSESDPPMRLTLIHTLGRLGDRRDAVFVLNELSRARDFDTVLACLTALARLARRAPRGPACTKPNRCRRPKGFKRKPCPGCGKRRIREGEALCTRCAAVQGICRICGGEEDPGPDLASRLSDVSFKFPDPKVRGYQPSAPDPRGTRELTLRQLLAVVRREDNRIFEWIQEGRKSRSQYGQGWVPGRRLSLPRGPLKMFQPATLNVLLEYLARSPRGLAIVREVVGDPKVDLTLRLQGLLQIIQVRPPGLPEFLKSFADLEHPQPLAETALRALEGLGGPEVLDAAEHIVDGHARWLTPEKKYLVGVAAKILARGRGITADQLMFLIEEELIARERERVPQAAPSKEIGGVVRLEFKSPAPYLENLVPALAGLGDPRSVDLLIDLLEWKEAPARAEAAAGLGLLGGERAAAALVAALEDADPWVRFMAYRAVRHLSGRDVQADWIYGREEERHRAVEAYREWFRERYDSGGGGK